MGDTVSRWVLLALWLLGMLLELNTLHLGERHKTCISACDMRAEHLLVTGHGLVGRVVRVESSLVEVVSVPIERSDMASIESSFTVHH